MQRASDFPALSLSCLHWNGLDTVLTSQSCLRSTCNDAYGDRTQGQDHRTFLVITANTSTCLLWVTLYLLSHLIHGVALKGGYAFPHFIKKQRKVRGCDLWEHVGVDVILQCVWSRWLAPGFCSWTGLGATLGFAVCFPAVMVGGRSSEPHCPHLH